MMIDVEGKFLFLLPSSPNPFSQGEKGILTEEFCEVLGEGVEVKVNT
jgi:hypothetical protein